MKQHITFEQLNKLYEDQIIELKKKLNLRRLLDTQLELKMYISECCTIGKMIEILCNSEFCFPSIGLTESRTRNEYIVVGVTCLSGSEKYRGKTFEGDNLCDALWESVKTILE